MDGTSSWAPRAPVRRLTAQEKNRVVRARAKIGPVRWTVALLALSSFAPLCAADQAPAARSQLGAVQRTSDGKPDLSGIWQVMNAAAWDIQDHVAQKGVPAGKG